MNSEGNLRVATTKGNSWDEKNPFYDRRLYPSTRTLEAGRQGMALPRANRFYAARFMGERGYLVTFKKAGSALRPDLKN